MHAISRTMLAGSAMTFATLAAAQVTFYEGDDFRGRSFTTQTQIDSFRGRGFNDRVSSVDVLGGEWEACEGAGFSGRCAVLRPGRYPTLASMGLANAVSSVRAANRNARNDDGYGSSTARADDYRRRDGERLYQANVISVHAVVGPPEQRCWIEHGQAVQPQSNVNVPGALAGALIGGILGHQVGHGTGNDVATIGGAVGGGYLGSKVGTGAQAQPQDIQRCENVSSQTPSYWDVTYDFEGLEHRVQMTHQPGPSITVNDQGEPRT